MGEIGTGSGRVSRHVRPEVGTDLWCLFELRLRIFAIVGSSRVFMIVSQQSRTGRRSRYLLSSSSSRGAVPMRIHFFFLSSLRSVRHDKIFHGTVGRALIFPRAHYSRMKCTQCAQVRFMSWRMRARGQRDVRCLLGVFTDSRRTVKPW